MVTAVGDDTRRDGWALVVQIKQAMAELYRREASYRRRRGLEGRAIANAPTGGRSYGYVSAAESGTGQREIDTAQAEVVRRIFRMYAEGMSARAILH
jgi:DNA invertase Pin-like site-specific DNA recombinase